MLFKKKKTDEAEEEAQIIEYTPEELQLIDNLVEDFTKAPGHVDIPGQILEAEPEFAPEEEETEEAEPESEAAAPAFQPKAPPKPAVDLAEFDDLATMDLDMDLESATPAPAETAIEPEAAGLEQVEEAMGEETAMETLPEDFDLGMPEAAEEPSPVEPAAEPSMEDFNIGMPGESEKEETPDFGADFEIGAGETLEPAAEPTADEFDLGMPESPAAETPDFGTEFDLGEPAKTTETDEFDLGGFEPTAEEAPAQAPVDDFDFDLSGGESAEPLANQVIDEMGLDSVPSGLDSADFSFDDLGAEEAPPKIPAQDGSGEISFSEPSTEPSAMESFGFDDLGPPSLDDVTPEVAFKKQRRGGLADELSDLAAEQHSEEISDAQLSALRYTLKSYSPSVRQQIIDILLGGKLSQQKSDEVIDKLVSGAQEADVKKFIEDALGKKIAAGPSTKGGERRVIVSRKQYTEKGIENRERLVRLTRIAFIAIPLILALTAGSYLFVIKRILYNNDIANGKEVILSPTFTPADIPKAEIYFDKAVKRYPKRSLAYLQFADAYRRQGLYENAFEKLFGKVTIKNSRKAIRYEGQEINDGPEFWSIVQKVPIVNYADKSHKNILINNIEWALQKPGAYIITHLDNKQDEAMILYALGEFHSSPARKFIESPYRNNRLGIDYFNRILNFKSSTPLFQKDKFISRAILGIGDVYYHNLDYNRAHDYFEKIIRKDPYNIEGQTGILKTLIRMYESPLYQTSDDPRLIIQQHSLIKHNYKIEKKLPLFILAKLARFYIDLPDKDNLRIEYNTSPVDRVNNRTLKSRAEELLNIIYNSTEEDIYGNKISGKTFAEGYYQRGRYYRHVVKEYRMAMTQFEYAYKYNPNHFMALNDRAEILMELSDYEAAQKHLKLAEEKIDQKFIDTLGDRPEDETLLDADRGIVIFNLAKSIYLARVKSIDNANDWTRIQETDKFENNEEYGRESLVSILDQVDMYFDRAETTGIKNEAARAELAYYRGWINYLNNDYARSLFFWQSISPSWDKKMPNLELAKSYALFYMATKNPHDMKRYLETSLSHLYYLESRFAPLAEKIVRPLESNSAHTNIFSKMTIIENNMGAIFELLDQEETSLKHYQQSIEYSKKINRENEIAHLNIRLSFKRKDLDAHEKFPLIMDFISPYLQEDL